MPLLLVCAALFLSAPGDSLVAVPARSPIAIDGRLDEVDWARAPVATGFRQVEPEEGAAPSQPTEVRVLYGETALYVGARLFDAEPRKVEKTLGRRDDINRADWFFVSIDSYLDRKTAFFFAVNAAGVQTDGTIVGSEDDLSWDAIWASAVASDSLGWTAELRIPYSMLRFGRQDVQTWGINFRRIIPRTAETLDWKLVRRADMARGYVAQFGLLEGLQSIRPRRNVQVTPYVVGGARTAPAYRRLADARYRYDAGADVRVGLSSNSTLDLTVNPDFGQVEADPAELNLSAFETVLRERRPFFVEGLEIFDLADGENRVLYTRRIGADAPVVGAAKLTGRTARGLSYGVLGAATGRDFTPARYYAAARARQALGRDSRAGLMATFFDHSPAGLPARRAAVGVADWDVRLRANTYAITGRASTTHREIGGNPARTGFSGSITGKRIGGAWRGSLGAQFTDAHYNLNDAGRMRRNNLYGFNGSLNHDLNGGQPIGPFLRVETDAFFGNTFALREGLSQGLGGRVGVDFVTRRYQRIELYAFGDYLFGGYDLYETRGRGPRAQPREGRVGAEFETDERRLWHLNPEMDFTFKSDGSRNLSVELKADANVGSRLELGAGVEIGRENGAFSWVANERFRRADAGWEIGTTAGPPDDDLDYRPFGDPGTLDALFSGLAPYDAQGRFFLPVFARRDGRTFDATVRATATFTPVLSLQLFSQLFAARGRYRRFALLTHPDQAPPFDAYPKRQAYAVSSFQVNAVLRWQYRPGSTLFVVWTQARGRDDAQDPFALDRPLLYDTTTPEQLRDVFGLFPENALLVKLSYAFLR